MYIPKAYYAIYTAQFVLESVTIHWGVGDLPGTVHLNNTNSPSSSSYRLPITLLLGMGLHGTSLSHRDFLWLVFG